jgi:hypothetical protein
MKLVGDVLHGMKSPLPDRAKPVAIALEAQIVRAEEKIHKYKCRSGVAGVLMATSEFVRFCANLQCCNTRRLMNVFTHPSLLQ